MKTLKGFAILAVLFTVCFSSGCFHSQAAKENSDRLNKRSTYMYEEKVKEKDIPIKYYKDNMIDAAMNVKEIGEPDNPTDIHNPKAVEDSQTQLKKEQETRGFLSSLWAKLLGLLAGLFGGGWILKIKNGYETVSKLFESNVKAVQSYKDKVDDFLESLGLDDETIAKIKDGIGRDVLNDILKKEADKTGSGVINSKLVEEIKSKLGL